MTFSFSAPFKNPSNFQLNPKCNRFTFKTRSIQLNPNTTSTPHLQSTGNIHSSSTGVVVIGAGFAGLAAATHLNAVNIPFVLLESSDGVGGRVRTDIVEGFRLDRGSPIFITAYPEVQKLLDYDALNLQKFYAGARVYYDGKFYDVADPLRHFRDAVGSLANPIGNLFDKMLVGLTRISLLTQCDERIFDAEEKRTIDLFKEIGFSDSIVERFFRPLFSGILFDPDLETSSRVFNFIFKCLALGDNTLPANGIGEISNQLASKLPPNSIRLNTKATQIDLHKPGSPIVRLANGESLAPEFGVILAVEEPQANKLLAGKLMHQKKLPRSNVCLYFTTDRSQIPIHDPVLYLNGSGRGIINSMFFPTNIAPSYSPPGKSLVSVSLIGLFDDRSDEDLTAEVFAELSEWFGNSMVNNWKYLKTYRIAFGQPNQSPPTNMRKNAKFEDGVYLCGDYMTNATFDGAFVSGRRAVEALLKDKTKSMSRN